MVPLLHEISIGIPAKGTDMQKTYKYEDIEQILAEADDLLQQIDPEIIEYLKEEQRAQLTQQAQSLKKLRSEVEDKIGQEGLSKNWPYSEGMHEAMDEIAKAMKALASYLA
jgi:seryl-tRNA synthetase